MGEPTKIAITGVSGRMGQMLLRAVDESNAAELVGVTERQGHDWIGRDIGEAMGLAPRGVIVQDGPLKALQNAHAVLDFTTPEATLATAEIAAQVRAAHVIGTTGLSESDLAKLEAAARHAPVIRSGNFSLGVNLLTVLARQAAAALGEEFDIEVVEMHHRHKVDAPSGTALMLGEAAAEGRGRKLADIRDAAREGITGARTAGHIGFAALRGGDVVGEHEVIFAGAGERIVLKHIASDRMLFARGALKAALWGHHRKPGQYSMLDVLGLDVSKMA
ncbi:MAG: 4-hydroxy-tetrahydrodipicolinate reductase [Rhodobacteraceae bacterium]|nr:4-hydroxy-tetrahydrodipicolinate reductase [Paracoccaceae bacterium]